ncbi:hypothetical protein, conserved [Eimeria brunetti]|uniref:Uncharacterized protein n=1 Tax=Eimeria brunetti TaxID=51314 RepID=U6LQR5_9EIME|nr:hypothetical protein, conserved [Eimeria brunetti]
MDVGPLPRDNRGEALQIWEAQVDDASAAHAAAKRPFWRLGRHLQLTPPLVLATLAVAFVLLHCYRRITFVEGRGRGSLRLLAEGKGAGPGALCLEADMQSHQPPAVASGSIEPALLERTGSVVRRLIQVTRDCSSVAPLLPSPFPLKLVPLFLGFCIQEVAALSELLGSQFGKYKADVLQKAVGAARAVKCMCNERITNAQHKHASRLEKYAQDIWNVVQENPPLTNEVRLQMLKELLELQEEALVVIEAVVSSVLKSGNLVMQVTEETAHELIEELKRVIYTRRRQVFKSRLLSRTLRDVENSRSRGVLVDLSTVDKYDAEPEESLKEQLHNLRHGVAWNKTPYGKDQSGMSDASPKKKGSPTVQDESQGKHSTGTKAAQASKSSSGRNHKTFEVPPRLRSSDCVPKVKKKMRKKQKKEGMAQADPGHSQHTHQTLDALSPSHEARSWKTSKALRHQAPATSFLPGQPLAELNVGLSELSLGPQARTAVGRSSRPAASSSLDTRLQPIVLAAGEILEESRGRNDSETHLGGAGKASWSPWSSAWVPHLPGSPPIPDSTAATAIDMAGAVEANSSHQLAQDAVSSPTGGIFPRVSSTTLFPFTTPQLILAAASEMLQPVGSQALPAEMQSMPQSHSRSTVDPRSSPTSSSPTREETVQSIGMSRSSDPERTPTHFDSVDEGMARSEVKKQNLPGLPLGVPGTLEVYDWGQSEGLLEESHWLENDSDSD